MTSGPDAPPPARVLVTRPAGSWPALSERFAGTGIVIETAATTTQVEPADPRPGDAALARLDRFAWLVVTSGQGVKALVLKLASRGVGTLPAALRVAAVGPATARALEGTGIPVALVADDARSEGLASSLLPRLVAGDRVLVVRPEGGPGLLAAALRAGGARVEEAPLYRTVASDRARDLADAAIAGRYDAVAFTAPSSLDLWLDAAGERRGALVAALSRVARIAIGPTTAAHLDARGLPPREVAKAPDEASIGEAIARALGRATC